MHICILVSEDIWTSLRETDIRLINSFKLFAVEGLYLQLMYYYLICLYHSLENISQMYLRFFAFQWSPLILNPSYTILHFLGATKVDFISMHLLGTDFLNGS